MIFTYIYNALKKLVYNIIISGCDQTENILEFKRKFICGSIGSSNLANPTLTPSPESDPELDELTELETVRRSIQTKNQFKSNTSPNLAINKQSLQIKTRSTSNFVNYGNQVYNPDWYCGFCKIKLSTHANMYCCNDNIFCTPNCRDRFLNYFRLNNNI